ncbi:MAG: sulfatase [bacterium]|nr:sulfatase [bacterium]
MKVLVAALTVAVAVLACGSRDASTRTRVVLITLDTLRYDRFEGSENQPSKMPLTRAHAERGLVFERYYTISGVTQPVHATLFSGLQPWQHGITRNGVLLPETMPSIVETMKRNGFETHAVVASFPLTRRFGFARGFDSFSEDFSHNLSENKTRWEGDWKIESGTFFAVGSAISRRALDALDSATADKQFFWFHYFDPHAPYGASSGKEVVRKKDILRGVEIGPSIATKWLVRAQGLYDADVRTLDRALDRVLQRLAKDEARYETHILVVSDHGESLGEGDSVGHGARLNEAELRVPAFILSPHAVQGARKDVVSTVDLAPTLLSLAGIEAENIELGGRDLTKPAAVRRSAFALRRTVRHPEQSERRLDGESYPLVGYLFGEIDQQGTIHRGNREGLLASDRGTEATEIVKRFTTFQQALEGMDDSGPLSPEVHEGLKALGYVE